MFRPNVAIIRYVGSALQNWYGYVMMVRSLHLWCLLYSIFKGHGGGVVSVMCAILGCAAQLWLLAAVLCWSPATVCSYPTSTAGGLFLWVVCTLSILCICGDLCAQSVLCVSVLVVHLGGVCVLLHYRRIWRFGDRVPDLFGNCRLALWYFTVVYISVVWCHMYFLV